MGAAFVCVCGDLREQHEVIMAGLLGKPSCLSLEKVSRFLLNKTELEWSGFWLRQSACQVFCDVIGWKGDDEERTFVILA